MNLQDSKGIDYPGKNKQSALFSRLKKPRLGLFNFMAKETHASKEFSAKHMNKTCYTHRKEQMMTQTPACLIPDNGKW